MTNGAITTHSVTCRDSDGKLHKITLSALLSWIVYVCSNDSSQELVTTTTGLIAVKQGDTSKTKLKKSCGNERYCSN